MPARPKRLYVIHHSHTDIGYTETQKRIERWQIDYIRQALAILDRAKQDKPEWKGFRWQCEIFWVVERFLAGATDSEKARFEQAVREGDIGLSGNMLNLNELAGPTLLDRVTRRAIRYGQEIGVPIESALMADINGFGWGSCQTLLDHGIRNMFTCINEHHGHCPFPRHTPFWWEAPDGERLLVWHGAHYHFGNELGLVPEAISSYTIKDDCDAEMIYGDNWPVAERRIPRLFDQLEAEGYPLDFLGVMASGLRSDNGPPNPRISETIQRWNEVHGGEITIDMVTLEQFFEVLREEMGELPVYRGDWPDWWSDGLASLPLATRQFREAQRSWHLLNRLVESFPEIPELESQKIEENLLLYAEHTFGHSDAMGDPWLEIVHSISSRKQAYAVEALQEVEDQLDAAKIALGGSTFRADLPLRYTVLNPWQHSLTTIIGLGVGHQEYHEKKLHRGVKVTRLDTGEPLVHQARAVPRGAEFLVQLTLEPGQRVELAIEPTLENDTPVETAVVANELDSLTDPPTSIVTPFSTIRWAEGKGLVEWLDGAGVSLLREEHPHAPFAPVYERTPEARGVQQRAVRWAMHMNRKGEQVERFESRFTGATWLDRGPLLQRVILGFELEGVEHGTVELQAWNGAPRVDVAVRLNKESRWEPENLYIPLPFSSGSGRELWLAKTGAAVRPRIDQIPGTLTDWYCVQEGLALVGDQNGLAIACPDAPLIQTGPLDPGDRPLHDPSTPAPDPEFLYAWAMTNYWETNFEASLAGFHEFRFTVSWDQSATTPESTLNHLRHLGHQAVVLRQKP
ncbi:glycoside hydrolase [bacterium]|nr:glycoside hydrolase [bacterium]